MTSETIAQLTTAVIVLVNTLATWRLHSLTRRNLSLSSSNARVIDETYAIVFKSTQPPPRTTEDTDDSDRERQFT